MYEEHTLYIHAEKLARPTAAEDETASRLRVESLLELCLRLGSSNRVPCGVHTDHFSKHVLAFLARIPSGTLSLTEPRRLRPHPIAQRAKSLPLLSTAVVPGLVLLWNTHARVPYATATFSLCALKPRSTCCSLSLRMPAKTKTIEETRTAAQLPIQCLRMDIALPEAGECIVCFQNVVEIGVSARRLPQKRRTPPAKASCRQ